jgi:hypothetical protein
VVIRNGCNYTWQKQGFQSQNTPIEQRQRPCEREDSTSLNRCIQLQKFYQKQTRTVLRSKRASCLCKRISLWDWRCRFKSVKWRGHRRTCSITVCNATWLECQTSIGGHQKLAEYVSPSGCTPPPPLSTCRCTTSSWALRWTPTEPYNKAGKTKASIIKMRPQKRGNLH